MNFISELRRRKIFQVAATYATVAWLLVQIIVSVEEPLNLPGWMDTYVIICLATGFPITLIISWFFNLTADGLVRDDGGELSRQSKGRVIEYVLTGLLILAVGTLLYREFGFGAEESAASRVLHPVNIKQQKNPPEGMESAQSVAVLPFVDLSPEQDQEYFADGLSEELLNRLAQLRGLTVSGRTSSFYFKGKNESLDAIGEALNVAHILEGSIRKSGDHIRVTAQLVKTVDGYQLWSENYDRSLHDIFAVQDEITDAVATALSITLSVGEVGGIEGGTTDIEAYREYLMGQSKYRQFTRDSVLEGLEHFKRAIEIDPQYALAWERLADLYTTSRFAVGDELSHDWPQKSKDALDKAFELAPDSAIVQNTIAFRQAHLMQWQDVEITLSRGAGLDDSTDINRIITYSGFLGSVGRGNETIPLLERAKRIDPLSGLVAWYLGHFYAEAGRTDEAMAQLEHALEIGELLPLVIKDGVLIALSTGDRNLLDQWMAIAINRDVSGMEISAHMHKLIDDREASLAWLKNATEKLAPDSAELISVWAAYHGAPGIALKAIRVGHDPSYSWRPILTDTRRLPGFRQFVQTLGLVDYWRKYSWGNYCHPLQGNDFECE